MESKEQDGVVKFAPGRSKRGTSLASSLSGTNLKRAGDYNQRVILQAVRVNGPLTRSDLVEMTGLTPPTIANISRRLLDLGMVVEAGRQHGGRGQPAMRLAVNPEGSFSIGVNIDRDHITVIALDLGGEIRARSTHEVSFALPDTVESLFRSAVNAILGSQNVTASRFIGIGVAMPDDLGKVSLPRRPDSYGIWSTLDVAKLFSAVLPLPVFVENDAAAAAMGELQIGHGLQSPSFLYVLISAGLGGGVVIDGNCYRGSHGRSGEIGFLPLYGRTDGAKSLQEVVSLSALYQRFAAAGVPITRPDQLNTLGETGAALVAKWLEDATDVLVDPLLAASCLLNPDAIFLGGRLPASLTEQLARLLNARLGASATSVPSIAQVQRAVMGADAPAVGAAILPFTALVLPSQDSLMKTMG